MIAFNLNEKLKEDLVLNYKAEKAETTHYPNGIMFMPERFFETIAYWDLDVEDEILEKALDKIEKSKEQFGEYCYFDGPVVQKEGKNLIIVWALFDKEPLDGESILKDYLTPL